MGLFSTQNIQAGDYDLACARFPAGQVLLYFIFTFVLDHEGTLSCFIISDLITAVWTSASIDKCLRAVRQNQPADVIVIL